MIYSYYYGVYSTYFIDSIYIDLSNTSRLFQILFFAIILIMIVIFNYSTYRVFKRHDVNKCQKIIYFATIYIITCLFLLVYMMSAINMTANVFLYEILKNPFSALKKYVLL